MKIKTACNVCGRRAKTQCIKRGQNTCGKHYKKS